jgi:hypothetical protein
MQRSSTSRCTSWSKPSRTTSQTRDRSSRRTCSSRAWQRRRAAGSSRGTGPRGSGRLVQQVKDRALDCPPQRLRPGLSLLPGGAWEATRRSLAYSPCLNEVLAGERGCVIARAAVGLNGRYSGTLPGLPAQLLQLSLQRIQFGTGNADRRPRRLPHFGASDLSVDRCGRDRPDRRLAAYDPVQSRISHGDDDMTIASRGRWLGHGTGHGPVP